MDARARRASIQRAVLRLRQPYSSIAPRLLETSSVIPKIGVISWHKATGRTPWWSSLSLATVHRYGVHAGVQQGSAPVHASAGCLTPQLPPRACALFFEPPRLNPANPSGLRRKTDHLDQSAPLLGIGLDEVCQVLRGARFRGHADV